MLNGTYSGLVGDSFFIFPRSRCDVMQYSNGEQECAGGVVDSCLDRMFEETYVKEVKNPSLLHVGGGKHVVTALHQGCCAHTPLG